MGLSHSNNASNDSLYTPKVIFEALGVKFDLDPAHPNHPTEVPTKDYFTELNDGLALAWYGFVWLNPPFRKSAPWVDKFIEHNNGIMLCQMSKSKWFWNVWEKADVIQVIPQNLKFLNKEGKGQTIFMPTCLVGMGEKAVEVIKNSNLATARVSISYE